jgi:hypothetical protein
MWFKTSRKGLQPPQTPRPKLLSVYTCTAALLSLALLTIVCSRGIQAEIELKKKELEAITKQNEALVEQNTLTTAFFELSNVMMGMLPSYYLISIRLVTDTVVLQAQ